MCIATRRSVLSTVAAQLPGLDGASAPAPECAFELLLAPFPQPLTVTASASASAARMARDECKPTSMALDPKQVLTGGPWRRGADGGLAGAPRPLPLRSACGGRADHGGLDGHRSRN